MTDVAEADDHDSEKHRLLGQGTAMSPRPVTAVVRAQRLLIALTLAGPTAHAQPDSGARHRILPLPALASAPETGLQYGATVLAVWEPPAKFATRPSSLLGSALHTSQSQTRVRLEAERWSRGNVRRVGGSVQWQRFPLPFYGVGDRTRKADEEIFTPTGVELMIGVHQRVTGAWYLTGGVRHLNQRIAHDSIGVLRTGVITGSGGGQITEWSLGTSTDTRDNLFAPRQGRWLQASYARSSKHIGSDFTYGTLRVDGRTYHALAAEHVLATQVQLIGVHGAAPFDQLALAGNSDILRGYARGRYRDHWLLAAQGEYRTPVRHRVGGVLFAGAGVTSPGLDALSDRRLLPTYGGGLRIQIDQRQRTAVRADYGRGRDGASGLYIGFNQAF